MAVTPLTDEVYFPPFIIPPQPANFVRCDGDQHFIVQLEEQG